MNKEKHPFAKVLGESLILSAIQISLASVEMSSKYSVMNFSKDQATLQSASNALTSYIFISIVWTIGSSSLLYSQFGMCGLVSGIISNLCILCWIVWSYVLAFKKAAKEYNLKFPKLFHALV